MLASTGADVRQGLYTWAEQDFLGERVTGIEPAWPAWKAGALPLSYTRGVHSLGGEAWSPVSTGDQLRSAASTEAGPSLDAVTQSTQAGWVACTTTAANATITPLPSLRGSNPSRYDRRRVAVTQGADRADDLRELVVQQRAHVRRIHQPVELVESVAQLGRGCHQVGDDDAAAGTTHPYHLRHRAG